MILSRQQMLEGYQLKQFKSKYQVEIFDQDELLCSYTLNKIRKVVFFTDELDRELFKKFCIIKNQMKADKIVVYCEYAYIDCPGTLEIVLNRETA